MSHNRPFYKKLNLLIDRLHSRLRILVIQQYCLFEFWDIQVYTKCLYTTTVQSLNHDQMINRTQLFT